MAEAEMELLGEDIIGMEEVETTQVDLPEEYIDGTSEEGKQKIKAVSSFRPL